MKKIIFNILIAAVFVAPIMSSASAGENTDQMIKEFDAEFNKWTSSGLSSDDIALKSKLWLSEDDSRAADDAMLDHVYKKIGD